LYNKNKLKKQIYMKNEVQKMARVYNHPGESCKGHLPITLNKRWRGLVMLLWSVTRAIFLGMF
jgi:hypothetical protein